MRDQPKRTRYEARETERPDLFPDIDGNLPSPVKDTSDYHYVPYPDEVDIRDREDAMGAYLMMFASIAAGLPLPFVNLLAAIIYYFVNNEKGRFVRFHLLQSLWSQVPVTVLNSVAVVWGISILFGSLTVSTFFTGFVIFLVLLNIAYFAISITGAIKARKGEVYLFPLIGQLCFDRAFRKTSEDAEEDGFVGPIN